jgi:hypothetical protein
MALEACQSRQRPLSLLRENDRLSPPVPVSTAATPTAGGPSIRGRAGPGSHDSARVPNSVRFRIDFPLVSISRGYRSGPQDLKSDVGVGDEVFTYLSRPRGARSGEQSEAPGGGTGAKPPLIRARWVGAAALGARGGISLLFFLIVKSCLARALGDRAWGWRGATELRLK